ncbi:hypothetical protein HYFRA_00003542 [Hymenoscyphus fraxineus]|uniref:3'-5' exonuclease domain-containing protein n=1 Tax=Hymenoscyphus fraxineus TaxID=746836 RepID=A0A9N9PNC4_9HELO|nr:hypothetical protein HYFRA_00003542 [Hymenoscyphus fraxineus]
MLRSHYGASTVARNLRRPFAYTMNSNTDSTISTLLADSMSATRSVMSGARAASGSTSPSRPRLSPQPSKTWHPLNGIVFSPGPGRPRTNTTTTVGIERDMALHSNSEDNYVLAAATFATSSTFVSESESKKVDEKSASTTNPAAPSAAGQKPEAPNPVEEELQDPKYDILPETYREWRMTEDLFRVAKSAPKESKASYWSHALYRGPATETDKEERKVTVHYCRSKLTTERVLEKYFADSKVIGFDIEWMINVHKNSGPKNNVSLIQIANEERVALFHLALYTGYTKEDLVSPLLKQILENPDVTKVGVAIKGDCTRIRKNLDIRPKGLFELSHLFKLVKFSESKEFKQINKKLISLATQVQEHFHLPMFKGGDVRSGAWNKPLDLEQIRYAASDSYAGIQLFLDMEAKRERLDPTPPRPYHAELDIPIRTAEGIEIPTDEPAEVDEDGEEIKPEDPEPPVPTKRKYTRKVLATPISGQEGKESIDAEEEPPAPKRKYARKPIPHFAAEESFDFEDQAIEGALMDHDYETPTTRSRTRTSRSKATPRPNPQIEKQEEASDSDDEYFECMRDPPPRNPVEEEPAKLDSKDESIDEGDPTTILETATSHALHHLTTTLPSHSTNTNTDTKQPTLSSLRTFYLWHQNPHLNLPEIASLLRSPPLTITTVTQHILEVASWEVKSSSLQTENLNGQSSENIRPEDPQVLKGVSDIEIETDRIRGILAVWTDLGFNPAPWTDLQKILDR